MTTSVKDVILASATRILTRKGRTATSRADGWQNLAWDFWETVPEVQAYASWVSNAMTGARLIAGRRGSDGTVEEAPAGSRASELVGSIAGGPDGQAELLGGFGTHLAIGGETWAVIVPDASAASFADDAWYALSSEEVKVQRGKIKATVDGEEVEILEPVQDDGTATGSEPVAIRIWDPSPRRHWEATSPVRASLVILEELRLLNAAVAAVARSRITGRGVLLVPAGTRFPSAPGQEDADSLLDVFVEVASTAIREPESAAATVPVVLEVPGDLIGGVKWLQFTTEFDALALDLREEAIKRFAAGADIPAEVLLGMGDVNHWGQWAITAEALRMGAEPRLTLVCNALTTEWLRPILEAEDEPGADQWVVWYDTSGLRSSSNKGASALEAFKLGLISDESARRELGFTEADAPDSQSAVSQPSTAAPPRDTGLPVGSRQSAPEALRAADDALAAAGIRLNAAGEIPYEDPHAGLVAAVDGLAWAALYNAGMKIMRTPACPRPERGRARELLAAASVHTRYTVSHEDIAGWHLLDGAWSRVPELAARYGADDGALTAALHDYVSALLVTGEDHTFDNTVRMLAQSGIIPSTLIRMVKP